MTDREKIIELLNEAHDAFYANYDPMKSYMGSLADCLIANGFRLERKQATSDKTSEWISVEEQQPKREVLAFSSECSEMLIGYVHGDGTVDGWCCESDEETLYGVTHWMPLPEPPKED